MILSTSPFKFLDSYEQKDLDIFFGRQEETEKLYHSLSGVKHLLVYGPSGAGKTSLIECGLRNQFSDADWFALSIRKGNDMLVSSFEAINRALKKKIELAPQTGLPVDQEINLSKAIQRLFSQRFQPIYLLFDQFEELLISGQQEEKETFFKEIDKLIRYRVPCRVLFIMREEFIGHLSEFEYLCPSIFENRFRLEKMTRTRVENVIQSILEAEYYEDYFEIEAPEQFAREILKKLPDDRKEIDLSHVQVFLSELWDRAIDRGNFEKKPRLDLGLLKDSDKLETVLSSFLKKQLKELEIDFGDSLPLELLAVMISESYTKLQISEAAIQENLEQRGISITHNQVLSLLEALEDRRMVRKLKSGDLTRFEIGHDTLALVVGQNLTEEMRLREKAQEIYRVYEERTGFFSQEDLDLIRPYHQYLAYPIALATRIKESEAYLNEQKLEQIRLAETQAKKERKLRDAAEKNANRAKQRTRVAAFIAAFALIIAVIATIFYNDADTQRNLVLKREEVISQKKEEADSLTQVAKAEKENAITEKNIADSLRLEAAQKEAEAQKLLAQYRAAKSKNVNTIVADIRTLYKTDKPYAEELLNKELESLPDEPRLLQLRKELFP